MAYDDVILTLDPLLEAKTDLPLISTEITNLIIPMAHDDVIQTSDPPGLQEWPIRSQN